MNKFLDILRARIDGCGIGDLEQYVPIGLIDEVNVNIDKILERIDSLGENAKRMLEIGVVQDELVKLGFELELIISNLNTYDYGIHKMSNIKGQQFVFYRDFVSTPFGYIDHTLVNWQEVLIKRAKELIK